MAYFIAVFDWSLYTLPGSIPMSDIEGDTHSNEPAAPGYSAASPSWIDDDGDGDPSFLFNGGASTLLAIDDDDPDFQDGYVETGGAQTLASDVTINGTTYLARSVVENEFALLDALGNQVWVIRIDGVNVGFAYPAGNDPSPGETFTAVVGRDGDPADSGDGVGTSEPYNGMVCFTPGTPIETPHGPRPVEELRPGNLVTTLDNGPRPVRWMTQRKVEFSDEPECAKPVEIKAGALAKDFPWHTIVVSPQHRFLVLDRSASRPAEVLVPAKALTVLPGIRSMKGKKSVQYVHLALDRHEIILAGNLLTESCYLGPVMLEGVPPSKRRAFEQLFPTIGFDPPGGYGPTARPVIRTQPARALLRKGLLEFRPAADSLGGRSAIAD